MALNSAQLKQRIISNLESFGFDISNPQCRTAELAEAIAKAVVDEIQSNAQVAVAGGSSAGSYKVA